MKNKFKKIVLSASIFLFANIAHAEPVAPVEVEMNELSEQEIISRIMDLSGLDVQIPQIADTLNNQSASMMSTLPDILAKEMSNLISVSFDGASMLEIVKNEVARSVSENEAKEILEWYATDLGIEITKLEETEEDVEDEKLKIEQKDELLGDVVRVGLMEELDKATRSSESAVELQISLLEAMIKMRGRDIEDSQVQSYIKKTRKEIEEKIRAYMLLSGLYTYRDLTEEEVGKYIDFLSKSTTQSFIEAVNRGTNKAILDGTTKFMNGVIDLKRKYGMRHPTK